MSDLTQYLDEAKANILEQRKNREELEKLMAENEELMQLIRGAVLGQDEPKPIDWSKVADCVPVKVWDECDEDDEALIMYPAKNSSPVYKVESWERRSLITGIDIAWKGGECPLPEGVGYVATLRDGTRTYLEPYWSHDGAHRPRDIIRFRVTGIAKGWTEEVGE